MHEAWLWALEMPPVSYNTSPVRWVSYLYSYFQVPERLFLWDSAYYVLNMAKPSLTGWKRMDPNNEVVGRRIGMHIV